MGWTGTFGRSELSKVRKSGKGVGRHPCRGKGPGARLPARAGGSPERAHGIDEWRGKQPGALMDHHPPRRRRPACALCRSLPPCSDGILTEPSSRATARGGAEREHVRRCPRVVFCVSGNARTAERGEIGDIASRWKRKHSRRRHRRELWQPQGRREESPLLRGGCRDGDRRRGMETGGGGRGR